MTCFLCKTKFDPKEKDPDPMVVRYRDRHKCVHYLHDIRANSREYYRLCPLCTKAAVFGAVLRSVAHGDKSITFTEEFEKQIQTMKRGSKEW